MLGKAALAGILLLPALTAGSLTGPPFPEAGEIALNDCLTAAGRLGLDRVLVRTLAFSPDGTRLAIEFGEAPTSGGPDSHYLLVERLGPPVAADFLIDLATWNIPVTGVYGAITWAPGGKSLVLAGHLISLSHEVCRLPGVFGGFLDENRVLLLSTILPNSFALGDAQCHPSINLWTADVRYFVPGISPDGAWIVLRSLPSGRQAAANTLILLPRSALEVDSAGPAAWAPHVEEEIPSVRLPLAGSRTIDARERLQSRLVFVENSVCGLFERAGSVGEGRIRCWNLQTGKLARESRSLMNHWINLTISSGGGRIAVGDGGHPSSTPTLAIPGMHAVWDYPSGQILAKWTPEERPAIGIMPVPSLAISPDGKLLAEGNFGSVRIYRLPDR